MSNVYKVDLESGNMQPIARSGGIHRSAAISRQGDHVASVYGNWDNPPEMVLENVQGKTAKILTQSHHKDFDRYRLFKPELFSFQNRHGDTISGIVVKPLQWKSSDKRPAIVYMYGGPLGRSHSVEVDNFDAYSYLFPTYMAAKYGYVMITIDPRGHSGYGRRFSDANFKNPGKPQVEDLEDLVKTISNGFGIDRDRIGLHGWSFGGYQTQMTMYTSPDTFACGISGAGPTEWENYNSWYTGRTLDASVRGKTTLKKYSLIPLAKNLKKPLLLVHGMLDDNVLYQDTVNVYRALLEAGKESLVELFVDPEGTHGLGAVVLLKGRYKKYESFFLRYLGKAE